MRISSFVVEENAVATGIVAAVGASFLQGFDWSQALIHGLSVSVASVAGETLKQFLPMGSLGQGTVDIAGAAATGLAFYALEEYTPLKESPYPNSMLRTVLWAAGAQVIADTFTESGASIVSNLTNTSAPNSSSGARHHKSHGGV